MTTGLLTIALVATQTALAAGWEAVQRLSPDQKVQVELRGRKTVTGTFTSASDSAVVVRSDSGEQSLARQDIRRIRVADPPRRIRSGLIWAGAGAAAGLAIGFAVCPGCANEGAGGKYTVPAAAAGAGLGAIAGLLRPPYRTIYRAE